MSFQILGIGTAVPKNSIDQIDSAEFAMAFCRQSPETERLLPALYRRCGVKRRHSVLLETPAVAVPHGARSQSLDHRMSASGDGHECCSTISSASDAAECESPVSQSFYEPSSGPDDCGPTTAQRMQVYERHAGHLAVKAAQDALAESAIAPSSVTHLITVSCTGFHAPGADHEIIRGLGLPAGTARTHLGFMGCHGALNALRVARAFADSDPDACVLIVAVELCSLHQQYGWQPDRIVANALFADGAAAVVGRHIDGNEDSEPRRFVANGSTIIADSREMMEWRITDHGFEMTLSPRVPELIQQSLKPWLSKWLAKHGLSIPEIGCWAIHPGGPKILSACAQAAGFDSKYLEPSRRILANYGNMSSPTVLFILREAMQHASNGNCVMLAFGPGLSIEAGLLQGIEYTSVA